MISTAELFGLCAIIINFIAYRQSNANRYRWISALALAALSIHFLLMGAIAGCVVTAIAVARNFIAIRWRGSIVLWTFVAINLGFLAWEITTPATWIALFFAYSSSLIFTVGAIRLNDAQQIRRWFLLAELLGLCYAIYVGSVSGTVFNLFNLTSIILKLLQDRRG
ncbi:YgjV family protein [Pseudidiomarina indica]|uniref:YgjV family protein n=1 Tax=Pseudidiomarina indica TaxID=1159017 RepID=UPI000ABE0B56|nr:YgjV family protein [Pseudidiomarina indica]